MDAEDRILIEVSEQEYLRILPLLKGTGRRQSAGKPAAVRSGSDKDRNDRQIRRSSYYLGSDELYRENLYYIRGYPACRSAVENAEREDRGYDRVLGEGRQASDPTFHAAVRRIEMTEARNRIRIVEEALQEIPERYRDGVLSHVVDRVPLQSPAFDEYSVKTWKRWTQRFVYEVAKRRGLEDIVEALCAAE